jgi:hypothetical protein
LSREITSCAGTSITTTPQAHLDHLLDARDEDDEPGPLTFQKRPSWNTTPRSYSRRMRSDEAEHDHQQHDGAEQAQSEIDPHVSASSRVGGDLERGAVRRTDADARARCQGLAAPHLPVFSLHQRPAGAFAELDQLARRADQRARAMRQRSRRARPAMPATRG